MGKKTISIISIMILIGIGLYWGLHTPTAHTMTITLTNSGFEPKSINIKHGDTVRFVSDTNRQFWPASDSHPSHGIFPDFDPKRPLEPHEHWEFTFNEPGSWNYHDHLSSTFIGTINVYSEFGQSTFECLDRNSNSLQAHCWLEEFKQMYTKNGFDGVFSLFKTYQSNDPFFSRNCHDIMHTLGNFAYEEYVQTGNVFDQPETSYCAFGFYHGFIERMIVETNDLTESSAYCRRLRTNGDFASDQIAADAEGACVHGFGHAIFDSLDGTLWGDSKAMSNAGLQVCENVFDGDFYESECGTGIWNALANAYSSGNYNLHYTKNQLPFDVCLDIRDIYKPGCYVEMVTQFSSWNGNTDEESFEIIRDKVEPIAKEKVYFAFVADAVQWRLPYDYKIIASYAHWCPREAFASCQYGIHYGILKLTSPFTNQIESQKVCAEYQDTTEKKICHETILNKL